MKIEKTFLKSKVAQRIASLFILCALLPIATLAVLSFNKVTKHLRKQSLVRLHQTSKTMSMAIYERLLFLEADMIRMASNCREGIPRSFASTLSKDNAYQKDRFKGIVIYRDSEEPVSLFENISHKIKFTPEEKSIMLEGESLLKTHVQDDRTSRIFLSRAVNPNSADRHFLLAEVDPLYLWFMGYETSLPAMAEFFVLDQDNKVLFSTLQSSTKPPELIIRQIRGSSSGQFDWSHEGKDYLASYREIFLQPKFQTSHWTIITSESKTYIYSPMASFKKTFFLIILLSLWIVIFLSFNQIRRSLIPLEKLKVGAQRIAKRDFNARVIITSRDEFADVAKAFNSMAYQLGRQFRTLTTIAEIDRAILSSFETEEIVNTLLNRLPDVFSCKSVGITLLKPNKPKEALIFTWNNNTIRQKTLEGFALTPSDAKSLLENPKNLFIELRSTPPNYLAPLAEDGNKFFFVFPIFLEDTLEGIISLGFDTKPKLTEEELAQARQLSDQMGIGLTNAGLIEELSDFNLGTLRALARAIDAKSPWTAGHSERVTNYGLEIGKTMGFAEEEMDILQRGGLLHDIGKIGIPNEILDKSGNLTEEERIIIQDHPRLGVRILEPIGAFTDVLRIVQQHHENYDGTGYPDNLSGKEISEYSRILAIADRYEALTADRPYRKAIDHKDAIKFIKENSGTQFDPTVVDAFLKALEKTYNFHLPKIDGPSPEYSARSPK